MRCTEEGARGQVAATLQQGGGALVGLRAFVALCSCRTTRYDVSLLDAARRVLHLVPVYIKAMPLPGVACCCATPTASPTGRRMGRTRPRCSTWLWFLGGVG